MFLNVLEKAEVFPPDSFGGRGKKICGLYLFLDLKMQFAEVRTFGGRAETEKEIFLRQQNLTISEFCHPYPASKKNTLHMLRGTPSKHTKDCLGAAKIPFHRTADVDFRFLGNQPQTEPVGSIFAS